MFTKLDQGGHPGFQLDVLGAVLVDSEPLDAMTQAQSFDQSQIQLDFAVFADVREIQQVEGRSLCHAGLNLKDSYYLQHTRRSGESS